MNHITYIASIQDINIREWWPQWREAEGDWWPWQTETEGEWWSWWKKAKGEWWPWRREAEGNCFLKLRILGQLFARVL